MSNITTQAQSTAPTFPLAFARVFSLLQSAGFPLAEGTAEALAADLQAHPEFMAHACGSLVALAQWLNAADVSTYALTTTVTEFDWARRVAWRAGMVGLADCCN